ncbi:MAG: hypothetical protein V1806_01790 [Pseudomonadota bacterium]
MVDLENTKGFSVGRVEEKMGIRASGTSELLFEDARIPKANLLGTPGAGLKQMLTTLDSGRTGIGSQALGIGRAVLEQAIIVLWQRSTLPWSWDDKALSWRGRYPAEPAMLELASEPAWPVVRWQTRPVPGPAAGDAGLGNRQSQDHLDILGRHGAAGQTGDDVPIEVSGHRGRARPAQPRAGPWP